MEKTHFQKIDVATNLNENQKINRISDALSEIKDVNAVKQEYFADVQSRDDLEAKLKSLIRDLGNIPYVGFAMPETILNGASEIIVETIMKAYDDFMNTTGNNISDFFSEKWGEIVGVFNKEIPLNMLQIRFFVDSVYAAGYSFEKNSQTGDYIVVDPTNNNRVITELTEELKAINGGKPNGTTTAIKSRQEDLDDILVERSLTGQGQDLSEMSLILREIGVNPEHENSLERITPKNLAEAYLKYYAKKINVPTPDFTNTNDVEIWLEAYKQHIPNERSTYIKLQLNGAFSSRAQDHDTGFLRDIMKEYGSLTRGTDQELQGLKEVGSNVGDMFKDGLPGLMKYMNGPEGLVILGGIIYSLFFSDFKKQAWVGILGLSSLNILAKAYNKDQNGGVLNMLGQGLQGMGDIDIKPPESLDGIESTSWLQNKERETKGVAIISRVDFNVLMDNIVIKNNLVEIKDFSIFSTAEIKALKILWPQNYETEVTNLLAQFLTNTQVLTRVGAQNIEESKEKLELLYQDDKYDNPSFSLVIAEIFLWNITSNPAIAGQVSQQRGGSATSAGSGTSNGVTGGVITGGTPIPSAPSHLPATNGSTPSVAPRSTPNLNIQANASEKQNYEALLMGYNGNTPDRATLVTAIKGTRTKQQLITDFQSILSGLTASDKTIINNLILELQS